MLALNSEKNYSPFVGNSSFSISIGLLLIVFTIVHIIPPILEIPIPKKNINKIQKKYKKV